MIILGIDPGLAMVGYSVIECKNNKNKVLNYGCILTDANVLFPQRLKIIYNELLAIIDKYNPTDMAVEELFFNKNVKSAIAVGQARGVEVLAGVNKGLDIYEYTPLQIKQSVTGYGRADKKQVQDMVKRLLNLKELPTPYDAADALAIAICHSSCLKFKEEFKMK